MRTASRALVALAVILGAIALPLYAVKVYQKTDYTDFSVYHLAASRMAEGRWDRIYSLSDGAAPFRYPPLLLPLLRPLAWLELQPAQLGWYFVQVLALALGFLAVYRASLHATRWGRRGALMPAAITVAAFLYVLRFCLDSFTIGQVSTLMFAGWAIALSSVLTGRGGRAGLGLVVPTLLKIGPGLSFFFLLLRGRPGRKISSLVTPALAVAFLVGIVSLYPKGGYTQVSLWGDWLRIVAEDASYFDASHYGSQSLNSFLLRAVNSGWLRPVQALELRLALSFAVCAGLLGFWAYRRFPNARGRGLAFSLSVFPYLWLMPETFKYSLIMLALPVAMLLTAERLSRPTWAALSFGALTLSLAGKDLVGDTLFFGMQHASLPFLATLLLGAATARAAWLESLPSHGVVRARSLLGPGVSGPWHRLPESQASLGATLILPLPLSSTRLLSSGIVSRTVEECRRALERVHGESWEIFIVPYGDRVSLLAPELEESRLALAAIPRARVLADGPEYGGRGTALRTGFLASKGRSLWIANPEQPCDAGFFEQASERLGAGFELVRANRRDARSRFRIPVRVLPFVYRRHRLGILFNRLVRAILPIEAEDTHSGTAVVGRRLATHAFSLQRYPEFLFELEMSLTALAHGLRETSLPVTIRLPEEKGVARIGQEAIAIALGLPSLWARHRKGFYGALSRSDAITADDWGISPEVNSGILDLAKQGIVRRVSLMANCPYLELGLPELLKVPGIELGLHFNLTHGGTRAASSPGRFLLSWCLGGRGRLAAIARSELKGQLARLEQVGVRARYIDGHHHIHLVPGLLRELAPEIRDRGIRRVRLPYDPRLWLTPKLPLAALSLAARGELRRQGFEHASCLYPQAAHFLDQGLLQAALARDPAAEVIVHPARSNDFVRLGVDDPYTEGRVVEYRALSMMAYRMRME